MTLHICDQFRENVRNKLIQQPFDIQPQGYIGSFQLNKNLVLAEAKEKNSILIDLSQFTQFRYKSGESIASFLGESYPDAIGIRFGYVYGFRDSYYVEIVFETASASEQALLKSVATEDNKTIYVSKPLPQNPVIFQTNISGIPFQNTSDIRKNLMSIFSKYGDILEMGLYVSEEGKWFTGRGYVTLITDNSKSSYKELLKPQVAYGDGSSYLALTHKFSNRNMVL